MADIKMCKGNGCPIRKQCLRYNACVDSHWQSYFMEAPHKLGRCDMFIEFQQVSVLDDGDKFKIRKL